MNVFISSGTADTIATPAHSEAVAKSTKGNFGKIWMASHAGGHSNDQAEFKKAMEWFISPTDPPKR